MKELIINDEDEATEEGSENIEEFFGAKNQTKGYRKNL